MKISDAPLSPELHGPSPPNNSFSQLLFPPSILENAHRTNLGVLGFHQRDPQGSRDNRTF